MTPGTGKEMDTVITVIAVVPILVDILVQIGAVIIIIILDFSGIKHLSATVGAVFFNYGQAVANWANCHGAHPPRKGCTYYVQMNQP